VNKDVCDEMVNWYSSIKVAKDRKVGKRNVSSNVEQELQLINGPLEFSIHRSNNIPWKIILKSSNNIHNDVQTSFRNSHVDAEVSDLKIHVNDELVIPSILKFE
jgi:hypothetical protein